MKKCDKSKKLSFEWETEEEKILCYMKISPKKKLEWLQRMHELLVATATPQRRKLFWKLRGIK
jgi:hypothetical protein